MTENRLCTVGLCWPGLTPHAAPPQTHPPQQYSPATWAALPLACLRLRVARPVAHLLAQARASFSLSVKRCELWKARVQR